MDDETADRLIRTKLAYAMLAPHLARLESGKPMPEMPGTSTPESNVDARPIDDPLERVLFQLIEWGARHPGGLPIERAAAFQLAVIATMRLWFLEDCGLSSRQQGETSRALAELCGYGRSKAARQRAVADALDDADPDAIAVAAQALNCADRETQRRILTHPQEPQGLLGLLMIAGIAVVSWRPGQKQYTKWEALNGLLTFVGIGESHGDTLYRVVRRERRRHKREHGDG